MSDTTEWPDPAPARPPGRRRRGFLRSLLLLPLVFGTVLGAVFGSAGSASANTAQGIASNAWIVSDLAAEVVNSGYSPVTEAESIKYGAATAANTAAAGVSTKPRAGKIGLIVNTVAMLGGLAVMWPGGEDAPALPSPAPASGGNSVTLTSADAPEVDLVLGQSSGLSTSSTAATVAVRNNVGGNTKHRWRCINGAGVESGTETSGGNASPGQVLTYSFSCEPGATVHSVEIGARTITEAQSSMPYHVETWQTATAPATDPALVPRYIDSTATCRNAAGGTQIISHREGPFTFDPAQPSTLPDVPDLECPAGTWLSSGKRELASEGSTETVPLTDYAAPDWVQEQATRFPECLPVGGQACVLQLFRKASPKYGDELNCNSLPAGPGHACRDWFTDPTRSETYECRFGSNVLPLRHCEPFRQTFTTGTVTTTPETETTPRPVGTDPTPEQTPNLGDCVPSWGDLLTPWWAFKATTCALSWAFKPQVAVSTRVDTVKGAFVGVAPFSWFAGIAGIPAAVPGGACPDWRIKVAGLDRNVVCDSSYTGSVRAARPVLLVFMGSLALWPLIRSTAYAAFPIIKPNPGVLR